MFDTVTVALVALPMFPAASYARAPNVWLPLAIVVVLNAIEYGELVSFPIDTPSRKNSTRVTPTLSVALAAALMVPVTVEPFAGDVIAAVGAVVSVQGRVETMMVVLGELLPLASKASTERV